jgi:pimeloyl-ACP methyl ester carboxylesterase
VTRRIAVAQRRSMLVDGLRTSWWEAGEGEPLVLLHGGEFGASAELGWEGVIDELARERRVIAPDVLGFGESAKVVDFADGRGIRIRHIVALCRALGITGADFVGNSMGAVMLLVDASRHRLLPIRRLVAICGGGEILVNEHSAALSEYDATIEAMRRIVRALFHDDAYPADDAYVTRRWESSIAPGAWESVAAARFRRPGYVSSGTSSEIDYPAIGVPTLVVEGCHDKLKPAGWAAGVAASIPGARSTVIDGAGHCPQLEQPERTIEVLRGFLDGGRDDG